MNCINNISFPFETTIEVPEGFYFNDENQQISIAVSTSDLNIYVVEEKVKTDSILHPCTKEPMKDLEVYLSQVRLSGNLLYRVALNALLSSYNFVVDDNIVVPESFSSSDGSLQIKVEDENGQIFDYVVIGYLNADASSAKPKKDDIHVILDNYNVNISKIFEKYFFTIKGEFSIILISD